jgi:hypothetical protein
MKVAKKLREYVDVRRNAEVSNAILDFFVSAFTAPTLSPGKMDDVDAMLLHRAQCSSPAGC